MFRNPEFKSDYDCYDDNMVASIANTILQIEPRNTTIQTANTNVGILIGSESISSFLNKLIATEIVENSSLGKRLTIRTEEV